jgi:hypothetical protein
MMDESAKSELGRTEPDKWANQYQERALRGVRCGAKWILHHSELLEKNGIVRFTAISMLAT